MSWPTEADRAKAREIAELYTPIKWVVLPADAEKYRSGLTEAILALVAQARAEGWRQMREEALRVTRDYQPQSVWCTGIAAAIRSLPDHTEDKADG